MRTWFMMLIATGLLAGCHQSVPKMPPPPKLETAVSSEAPPALIKPAATPLPHATPAPAAEAPPEGGDVFQQSQRDVELTAKWLAGGAMEVVIMNKMQREVAVGPDNFALIIPPNKSAIIKPLAPSSVSFPVVHLKPGGQATGILKFPAPPADRETRVVFNHPATRPAVARVR